MPTQAADTPLAPQLPLQSRTSGSTAPARRWALPRMQEAGLIVVILIIGLTLALGGGNIRVRGQVVNNFFRPDNLLPNVFTPMSWMAIMAVGATVVIVAGGIDISVGSIFGLAALGCAAVLQNLDQSAPAWKVLPVAVVVPLGVGLICGLINGALVVYLRMHPFIVTLGTMSIFRGIALVSVREGSIPSGDKLLPDAFTNHFLMYTIQYKRASGIPVNLQPVPMIIMLACVIAGWIYLSLSVAGRENYAVGGNEEAARFSGLRVSMIKLRVYALSGLSAGIAGFVSCGYFGSASQDTGNTYELMVIAAAVVGGASLNGGRGSALGAMLGALVIQLIDNGLYIIKRVPLGFTTLNVSKEYSKIIVGSAIIVAVAIDQLSQYLTARRLAGTRHAGGREVAMPAQVEPSAGAESPAV
jgi:ribose/xylose/arabinose/galactoside ABC-type transport system permease subunit